MKPTIAFFGATGGCASQALALALQAGYNCTALARTPSKLENLLTTQFSLSASTLSKHLTIVPGNAKSVADVQRTLYHSSTLAEIIVFGIGGTPAMQWNLLKPVTLTDPNICASGMSTIVSALRNLTVEGVITTESAPRIVAISTTGISKLRRDVPMALYPLYHWLLQVPHADKAKMESLIVNAVDKEGSISVASSFIIVRPTLLVSGAGKGLDKVRVGWERYEKSATESESAPGPALGYTVSRSDVGRWIFEEAIKNPGVWENQFVTLTF